MSCGLTARTTTSAPLIASGFDVVASTPCRSFSSAARSSRRDVATMSAQSELRSPAISDSPIRPAPRIAILIGQAYGARLIPRQEVDAREACPLSVRREQGVGLLRLDPAAPERARQLDEAEIPRQPALVAAEALETDDAGGPRAEPALALEPARDGLGGHPLQRLEVERAAEPHERRPAPGAEPEVAQPRRREPPEVGRGRSTVEPVERRRGRADHGALDQPRALRRDQLAGDGAQEGVGDRGGAQWTEPSYRDGGLTQQRVAGEAPQELRMVVFQAEDRANVLDAGL